MRALFVNSTVKECGVYQYGENLFNVLIGHSGISWMYSQCKDLDELRYAVAAHTPDLIVYNWQSGIGGYMLGAPFTDIKVKQVLVYHDNDVDESRWDAFLFSDPTMTPRPKWFPIGRPLPSPAARALMPKLVRIGVHGFVGAQANIVLGQVIKEFEYAEVRLHLPVSPFCDDHGNICGAMAGQCRDMVNGTGIRLNISHDFKPPEELKAWLAENVINCYFRDPAHHWRGVSSALDMALAARRPIAINKSSAFRHMHSASPSICIEDRSLHDIISTGLAPLVPFYEQWSPEAIAKQVDNALLAL